MSKTSINWGALILIILGVTLFFIKPFNACVINLNPFTWIGYLICSFLGFAIGTFTIVLGIIFLIVGAYRLTK